MTTQPVCPRQDLLAEFGFGRLDSLATEEIAAHLSTCADCRKLVAHLSQDTFVDRLVAAERGGPLAKGTPGDATNRRASWNVSIADRTLVPRNSLSAGAGATASFRGPGHGALPSGASLHVPLELASHADYEFLQELGRGGMGVVYLARNRLLDRLEVLKIVGAGALGNPLAIERFLQEIRAAARLNHPNIVAAHQVLRLDKLIVFSMEYVAGKDLSRVVRRLGPLPALNAVFYAYQVAIGLQHAHEKGMIHRDIKPSNLVLWQDGKKHIVKILDFGLAKAASEQASGPGLTRSGQILGTPHYMAPEQSLDPHKADIRADIYSLGCTLCFLLTGRPPFEGATVFEILQAHHERSPEPLHLQRPEIPFELTAVVGKMMAKSAGSRYQTPREVAKALLPFFDPSAAKTPATGSNHSTRTIEIVEVLPTAAVGEQSTEIAPSRLPTRRREESNAPLQPTAFNRRRTKRWIPVAVSAAVLAPTSILFSLIFFQKPTQQAASSTAALEAPKEPDDRKLDSDAAEQSGFHNLSSPPTDLPKIDADGFSSMFDGRDLDGWDYDPKCWRVENGAIVGIMTPEAIERQRKYEIWQRSCCVWRHGATVRDFVLRAKVKIENGNSGICFRGKEVGEWQVAGYQADFSPRNGITGSLYEEAGRRGLAKTGSHVEILANGEKRTQQLGDPELISKAIRHGDWIDCEISAIGSHLSQTLNGVTTFDVIDEQDPAAYTKFGVLALEANVAAPVQFKDLKIKLLPSPDDAAVRTRPTRAPGKATLEIPAVDIVPGKPNCIRTPFGGAAGVFRFDPSRVAPRILNGEIVLQGPESYLVSERNDFGKLIMTTELLASAGTIACVGVNLQEVEDGRFIGRKTLLYEQGGQIFSGMQHSQFAMNEMGMHRVATPLGNAVRLRFGVKQEGVWISVNEQLTSGVGFSQASPKGAIGFFVMQGELRIKQIKIDR